MFMACFGWAAAQEEKLVAALTTTPIIEVKEQDTEFRNQVRPAFVVFVLADESDFEKDWKNYMLSACGIELKRSSGYLEALKVKIAAWSNDSLNLYSRIGGDADGVKLTVHVENNTHFIHSGVDSAVATNVKSTIHRQVKEFYIKQYDNLAAWQQRNYERQMKDLEKLQVEEEKLRKEILDNESAINKSRQTISELSSKQMDNDNAVHSTKQELEFEKKELDNLKRDLDLNVQKVNAKQKEYDQLNYKGNLNTKEGEKVMKELDKLRSEQEKMQNRVTSKNADLTKTESSIFDLEQEKSKLENKQRETETAIGKCETEIKSLENELEKKIKEIADKKLLAEEAKNILGKLQNAKAGLIAQ